MLRRPRPAHAGHPRRGVARRVAVLVALLLGSRGVRLDAQAAALPSLQPPVISDRDYTAALVGGGGAALLVQWREGMPLAGDRPGAPRMHWLLEAGLADAPGGTAPRPLVGAGVARRLLTATADQPLDAVWTAGAGVAWVAGGMVVRLPVGLSVGHAIPLPEGRLVTPFAHPRVVLESRSCGTAACGESRGAVALAFDLGAVLQVTPSVDVRGAVLFAGGGVMSGGNRLAVGMNWTPPGLSR